MKKSDRLRIEALFQELYDRVPPVRCKGLCWDSCTTIDISVVEHERARRLGVDIPLPVRGENGKYTRCPALTVDQRCSIHADRPMICRLFGAVAGARVFECGHNCEVGDSGPLPYKVALGLYYASLELGGWREEADPEAATAAKLRVVAAKVESDILGRVTRAQALENIVNRVPGNVCSSGTSLRCVCEDEGHGNE